MDNFSIQILKYAQIVCQKNVGFGPGSGSGDPGCRSESVKMIRIHNTAVLIINRFIKKKVIDFGRLYPEKTLN